MLISYACEIEKICRVSVVSKKRELIVGRSRDWDNVLSGKCYNVLQGMKLWECARIDDEKLLQCTLEGFTSPDFRLAISERDGSACSLLRVLILPKQSKGTVSQLIYRVF